MGGALAAVSSAVLLSTLGTAGTLIGAAIGSLVITVGGAVYAHSLRVAKARIAARSTTLVRGKGATAADVVEEDAPGSSRIDRWRQVLRELPWKRILVASAAVFVVAMSAILAFELATGRPVSSYTGGTSDTDGGTSVPGVGGGDDRPDEGGPDEVPQEPEDGEEQAPEEQPEEEPAPVEEEPVEPDEPVAPVEPAETAAP